MQTFTGGRPILWTQLLSTSLTLLVSGLLVAAPQATASANPGGDRIQPKWVQKVGGKITCGAGGSRVSITAHGSGDIIWWAPNGTFRYIGNHGDHIYSETWDSNATSYPSWKVESNGYLQDAGTYAFCRPPDAPTGRAG